VRAECRLPDRSGRALMRPGADADGGIVRGEMGNQSKRGLNASYCQVTFLVW
jgi:hypothetical protein